MINQNFLKNAKGPAKKILQYFLLSIVFLVLAGVAFFGVQWFSDSLKGIRANNGLLSASLDNAVGNATTKDQKRSIISQNFLPLRDWQIPNATMPASAGISVEIGSGVSKVLFNKNEDKKLPIASLTKLMTALIVLKKYDLLKSVTISPDAMLQEGDQGLLKQGQILSIKDLLYITLMESSNRSAYALAEQIGAGNFIALMNKEAKDMGLTDTHFADSTGLDPGSYSTAKDLTTLTQYLFENYPLFKEIISLKQYDVYFKDGSLHHKLQNTNELLGQDNIIGGKTGFTSEAKGCVMTILQSPTQGNYIINVVLGSSDRFVDMDGMIQWVRNAYQWQ